MRYFALILLIGSATALRHGNNSRINHVGFGKNASHYWDNEEQTSMVHGEALHKTGFYYVDCLKDDMLHTADMHGGNKDRFRESHPISIVRYDVNTAKEDREDMTPEVCFDFCRRVTGAVFFGLEAGRTCYCMPYFSRIAGDSTDCDAPCDGDKSQMCGGMKKSAIYSMHECEGGVLGVLDDEKEEARAAKESLEEVCNESRDYYQAQYAGLADCKTQRDCFAQAGDSLTSWLMQESCPISIHNQKGKQLAENVVKGGVKLMFKADQIDVSDPDDPPAANDLVKLEGILFDLEQALGFGKALCGGLKKAHHANFTDSKDIDAYLPITHFLDTSNLEFGPNFTGTVPSSCKGTLAGEHHAVHYLQTIEDCAASCSEIRGEAHCIAFVWSTQPNLNSGGKCFLLSEISTILHYEVPNSCDNGGAHIVCGAKFASMKGFELRLTSKEAGVDHVEQHVLKECVPGCEEEYEPYTYQFYTPDDVQSRSSSSDPCEGMDPAFCY